MLLKSGYLLFALLLVVGRYCRAAEFEDLIEAAQKKYEQGLYVEALTRLKTVLAEEPLHPIALLQMANIHVDMQELDKAEGFFQHILAKRELKQIHQLTHYYAATRLYLPSGDLAMAGMSLEHMIQFGKQFDNGVDLAQFDHALMLLASLCLRTGQTRKALDNFARVNLVHQDLQYYVEYGTALFGEKEFLQLWKLMKSCNVQIHSYDCALLAASAAAELNYRASYILLQREMLKLAPEYKLYYGNSSWIASDLHDPLLNPTALYSDITQNQGDAEIGDGNSRVMVKRILRPPAFVEQAKVEETGETRQEGEVEFGASSFPSSVPLAPTFKLADGYEVVTHTLPNATVQVYTIDDFLLPHEPEAFMRLFNQTQEKYKSSLPHLCFAPDESTAYALEAVDISTSTLHDHGQVCYETLPNYTELINFSKSTNVYASQSSMVKAVEERIERALGVHASHAASTQILRYDKGHDAAPHQDCSYHLAKKSQRSVTVLIYLSESEGGETQFPRLPPSIHLPNQGKHTKSKAKAGKKSAVKTPLDHFALESGVQSSSTYLSIKGKVGKMIVFTCLTEEGFCDPDSLHEGAVLRGGTKWLLQKWYHTNPQGHFQLGPEDTDVEAEAADTKEDTRKEGKRSSGSAFFKAGLRNHIQCLKHERTCRQFMQAL